MRALLIATVLLLAAILVVLVLASSGVDAPWEDDSPRDPWKPPEGGGSQFQW